MPKPPTANSDRRKARATGGTDQEVVPEVIGQLGPADDSDISTAAVGERLRSLRRMRNLTLQEVARGVGMSHSFLSQLERGDADISLSRFRRLAQFYSVRASDLLLDQDIHNRPMIAALEQGLEIDRGKGVKFTLLPNREYGIEVGHAHVDVGGRFRESITHKGADIVWVIRGELTLHYGADTYTIPANHCVSFAGSTPHYYENLGPEPCEAIGIATVPYW